MTNVGIDIHRSTSTFAWRCPSTGAEKRRCISTTPEAFAELLSSLPRPWTIAYEATRQAPMVTKLLRHLDADQLRLVHPRPLEVLLSLDKANTDGKAALKILHLLEHEELFPEAYLAPPEVEEDREISRAYTFSRQEGTRLQNQLRTLLNKAGLNCASSRMLTKKGQELMPQLISQLAPYALIVATMYWERLLLIHSHCEALKQLMKERVTSSPVGRAILKLQGTGIITTFGMMAEIGEIERFASCRRLNSYAGIVPKIHQSDKYFQVGHLSQDCNKHLRYLIVCATQAAVRCKKTSKAKETYQRVKRNEPKRACLAKIAAARKLLIDVFWAWKEAAAQSAAPCAA
jgi:transposase